MRRLDLRERQFLLATMHHAENVDSPVRLKQTFNGLAPVAEEQGTATAASVHPRTESRVSQDRVLPDSLRLRMLPAMGFFDFVKLEMTALAVLSDSGTVQEECAIFGVPNVTLRDVTERPETLACGSNGLSGPRTEDLKRALVPALSLGTTWEAPAGYQADAASRTVAKIALGYHTIRRHHSFL